MRRRAPSPQSDATYNERKKRPHVEAVFLIKILWAWTIPDLFPGAVEQGLIAGEISWFASLKLALFLGILSAIVGVRGRPTSVSH